MKLRPLLATLPLLAGCASSPPPAPTPPKPAMAELANEASPLPAPKAAPAVTMVRVDHPHWSMDVPSNWKIDENTDDRFAAGDKDQIALQLITVELDNDVTPEAFASAGAAMTFIPMMVPSGLTVDRVEPHLIKLNGVAASASVVRFDRPDLFMGVLAQELASTHTGYILPCFSKKEPQLLRLCGAVQASFTLKP